MHFFKMAATTVWAGFFQKNSSASTKLLNWTFSEISSGLFCHHLHQLLMKLPLLGKKADIWCQDYPPIGYHLTPPFAYWGPYCEPLWRDLFEKLRRNLGKLVCFYTATEAIIMIEQACLLRKFHNYGSVKLYSPSSRIPTILQSRVIEHRVLDWRSKTV